jgi:xanthine dehydrogenase accessory factor
MADDHLAVYQALVEAQQQGIPSVLATIIETQGSMPRHVGSKMIVYADGGIVGTVGGGAMESSVIQVALDVLSTGKARTERYTLNRIEAGDPGICGGTATIFIEPLQLPPTLLVIGAGHVGQATAELGKWLGFRVILSDDRAELCNAEVVPNLDDYVVVAPDDITAHVPINANTYIVAVTRGLPIDGKLFPPILASSAAYIGLIGSRRRWALTRNKLKSLGITDEALNRVHSPIGLELEAETPKEIAISILSEIIMIRRGGTGQPMSSLNNETEA